MPPRPNIGLVDGAPDESRRRSQRCTRRRDRFVYDEILAGDRLLARA
jgi:hypothetical protein